MSGSIYKGPLAGVKVIDFGWYYAGAMTGMLLADQGAEVIRIVKPGDRELPDEQYRVLNRNKKLLVLDLKTEEGKEQALALIEKADVLIENFRPGVMKRLGLDYTSVKQVNPGLVYLSLPGFASTDKERAHLQAWEGVLSAAACVFTQTSPVREILKFPPVYTWIPQCSTQGAMHGAVAVAAALTARETRGCGTVIEVPLVTAGLSPFASYLQPALQPAGGMPETLKSFAYDRADSEEVQIAKMEGGRAEIQIPPFYGRPYKCADGRSILIWAPDWPKAIRKLFRAIGIERQALQEGYVNEGPWVTGVDNNVSNGFQMSVERRNRITQLIADALLARTAEEWEAELQALGVPTAVIRTRDEWLGLEAMLKSGVLTHMGDLTVPGRTVDVSGLDEALMQGFSEAESIGYSDDLFSGEGSATHKAGDLTKGELLSGLRVLDLTNLVAGPNSNYTLAQYGATVIKADPPEFLHPGLINMMVELNQGKRSLLLDLTCEPGRKVFERLIKWADVIVHNSVDGTAERLGVSFKQVQAINPDAVVCQFSAFGGSFRNRGGWERRTGFDPLAQCSSGMTVHFGSFDVPHTHGSVNVDIMGGLGTTFAATLAVYQKQRTGHAGEARTSLARVVNFVQLPCMVARDGRSEWGEQRGQFALGPSWHQRLYECKDGWLYVETPIGKADALANCVIGKESADTPSMEAAFKAEGRDIWLQCLTEAGIACHAVLNFSDIVQVPIRSVDNSLKDEQAQGSYELVQWDDHPSGTPIMLMAPTWSRVGEKQTIRHLPPAPRYGSSSREILTELGYSDKEVDQLISLRAAHTYIPAIGTENSYFFEMETNNETDSKI